jgi:nucleotide-binding universal stress UspA family protein
MENILVPIGSSENAINTLQYAIDFVEGTNVKIYVIKVYGVAKAASSMKNIDAILQEDSDKELKSILREVNTKGVEIITKSIKGDVIDSIERAAKQLKVNLIISSTQNISTNDKVYLGRIAGGLIKSTDIPILIVPKEYVFKKVLKVFMAIKSGIISSPNVLVPLNNVLNRFDAKLDLIRVITANSKVEDSELNKELEALKTNYKTTENATVFQGVLEFIHEVKPDMICVIRRKRGFFKRLWENDRVYKKDFESRIPLLVLKGAF